MSTPARQIPQRGDIFWANLPSLESVGSEQRGTRPVLVMSEVMVVSVDQLNQRIPVCVIVPLSAQVQKENRVNRILIPENQKISEPGTRGCPGDSLALTEQIRCISVDRLDGQRVGRAKPGAIAAVETGIKYVLRLA
ncbi:MAG: type II toxin-antitoxin system PemK/MazF family toxin [Pyrinomonadaceae bacterium]